MQITDQSCDKGADANLEYATAKPKLRTPPIKRQKMLPKPPPAIGEKSSHVAPKPKLRTPPIKLQNNLPAPPPRLDDRS